MRDHFSIAVICVMAVVDIVLTGIFIQQRLRTKSNPAIAPLAVLVHTAPQPIAATDPETSAATFILLREPDISGGQPWVCPSSIAAKWDYGGGTNTAQNWMNWNGSNGFLLNESCSYENLHPNDQAIQSSSKP